MFQEGLLFIGDWHTHPERIPSPSRSDLQSIRNIYNGSAPPSPRLPLAYRWYRGLPFRPASGFHSATAEIILARI